MNNTQTNFYDQLVDKYLTRRNIIIAAIVVVVVLAGIFIWNWYYQATIIIQPNIDNVTIRIESSPTPNEEFTIERNELATYNNVNQIKIKVEPNLHYYIITSKDGYTTSQEHINPGVHQTITVNPILVEPLISSNITNPTLSNDQQDIIYIDENSNQLSSLNLFNQQSDIIESNSWYGVQEIIYSPDKTKAILKVKNDNVAFAGGFARDNSDQDSQITTSPFYKPELANDVITTWTYDIDSGKLNYLNPSIKNIAWYNNDQIIYEYLNINSKIGQPDFSITNTLNIADIDGSNWQNIQTLNNTQYLTPKIIPSPTNPNQIILLPQPSEGGQEIIAAIYLLNIETGNIDQITEKNIIDASWSPDGQKILYSQLDPEAKRPLLYIINIDTQEITSLNLYSYIYKTDWISDEKIAIAVPTDRFNPNSLSPNNIPQDYYTNPTPETFDTIYIVDINNTEERTNMFANNFDYLTNVHNIFNTNENIYFQDQSNQLYTLPLNNT